jgi:hypothetical protein
VFQEKVRIGSDLKAPLWVHVDAGACRGLALKRVFIAEPPSTITLSVARIGCKTFIAYSK